MHFINSCKRKLTRQIWLAMRLSIVLLTVAVMHVAAKSNSQTVNLSGKGLSLKKVFSAIKTQTGYVFFYDAKLLKAARPVTIELKNSSVENALTEIFDDQPLTWLMVDKTITVVKKTASTPETLLTAEGQPAPPFEVPGIVTDDAGKPLIGATVKLKGSGVGTSTDVNGRFTLQIPEKGGVLEVSNIGYLAIEVPVSKNSDALKIALKVSVSNTEEIVVVGYGTQKRSTLTGAISTVNSKTLNVLPVASIDQALQGRVAGLTVTNNGSPGSAPLVSIRGISSISYGTDPLYVVDGFPTANLSNFDGKEVESVEVLKDASAAAIYGSRGTNGVILITTKKGKKAGPLQVNLDTYIGVQNASKKMELLNTDQYLQYERMLNGNAGIGAPPRLQSSNFNQPIYAGATQTYAQTNTDWQDEYFKGNALITHSNISVAGGNGASRFYSSAGYFKQDGIGQGVSYERGNFRINSEHDISKVFTFGQNLYASVGEQYFDRSAPEGRNSLTNVIRMQPYLPVKDPTTQSGYRGVQAAFDGSDPINPIGAALSGYGKLKTLKILGTAFLDVNLTSWLKFRSVFGVDYSNANNQQYRPIYDDNGTIAYTVAEIRNARQINTTLLFTQQLTFDKSFGHHRVNATAVIEQQGNKSSIEEAVGNQNTNAIQTLNGATNVSASSRDGENVIHSLVGRISYQYAGKYILNAAIRRDGLSVWAPGNKYGNFPSASIGWRVDREAFLQQSKSISELKIRAGYGVTGLNGTVLGNYPYTVGVSANQGTYPFAGQLTIGNTSFSNALSNPALAWEKTKQFNVGVDLGLFQNAITITAEYYKRKTDNLILKVPTPLSLGFDGSGVLANVAAMQNHGFELQVGYHKTKGEFKWDIMGLLSFVRNKVTKLNTENASITAGGNQDYGGGDPFTNTVAGQPVQSFYGYVVDGIFQNQAEVDGSPVQIAGKTAPGDLKFRDLNKDGKIDANDRTFIGSFLPKFSYSVNYTATYKNFDFALFFQGNHGSKIVNAERIILEGMPRLFNASVNVLNAWTPTNTGTDMPRAIAGDPNQNVRPSTRWIESGSYLRVKNVMLGFNLAPATMQKITKGAISRLRVYVSAQNLLTFTNYNGWDPEVGSAGGRPLTLGVDYGQYPSPRSFQFGVQVGF